MWILLVFVLFPPADAVTLYDPQLCYILDGFLGLYGLIITGMFINEKFFRTKVKKEESIYSDLEGQDAGAYSQLMTGSSRNRGTSDDNATYTGLNRRSPEGEYKELPVRDRQRKNEQVYQGLSTAARDTYDSLQMQPLPPR